MSIPFTYSLYESSEQKTVVKEVKGIISFANDELLFEFKVYNVYGKSISSLNKFSIDIDQLKRVYFKKGFFRNILVIEASTMAFLDPLPGSEQGMIKLNTKREHRNEAARFSSTLNLILSQKRLDEME